MIGACRDKRWGLDYAKLVEREVTSYPSKHLQLGAKRDGLCGLAAIFGSLEAMHLGSFCVDPCPGRGRYWDNDVCLSEHNRLFFLRPPSWQSPNGELVTRVRRKAEVVESLPNGGVGMLSLCEWFYDDESLADMMADRITYMVTHKLPKGQHSYSEFSYSRSSDGLVMYINGGRMYSHAYRDWGTTAEPLFVYDRWSWRRGVVRAAFQGEVIQTVPMVTEDEQRALLDKGQEVPELLLIRFHPVVLPFDVEECNVIRRDYNRIALSTRVEGLKSDFESLVGEGRLLKMDAVVKAVHMTRHHARPMVPVYQILAEHGETQFYNAFEASMRIQHEELRVAVKHEFDVKYWVMLELRRLLALANHYIWRTGMVKEGWSLQRSASKCLQSFFRTAPDSYVGRDGFDAPDSRACGCVSRTPWPPWLPHCCRQSAQSSVGQGVRTDVPELPAEDVRIRRPPVEYPSSEESEGEGTYGGAFGRGREAGGGEAEVPSSHVDVRPVVFPDVEEARLDAIERGAHQRAAQQEQRECVALSHVSGRNRRVANEARERLLISAVGKQIPRQFKSEVPVRPIRRQRDRGERGVATLHQDGGRKRKQKSGGTHDRSDEAKGVGQRRTGGVVA